MTMVGRGKDRDFKSFLRAVGEPGPMHLGRSVWTRTRREPKCSALQSGENVLSIPGNQPEVGEKISKALGPEAGAKLVTSVTS